MGALFSKINELLSGWKSRIGAIGAVATFVLVVTNALGDGFQIDSDPKIIIAAFSAMMLAIGLTHKAEKIEKSLGK